MLAIFFHREETMKTQRLSLIGALFVLSLYGVREARGQGFSNWSTPVNLTTINTSSFEG